MKHAGFAMRRAIFLLVFLVAVGCSGTARTAAFVEPGHLLASARSRDLCIRTVHPRSLGAPHCVKTRAPIEQAVFVDGEHVAALLEDGSVVVIGTDGTTRDIGLPPEEQLERAQNAIAGLNWRSSKSHIRRGAIGELFFALCTWWRFADAASACYQWVEARLLPTPTPPEDRDTPPGFRDSHVDLPERGSPSAGISVTLEQPEGGDAVVTCRRGAEVSRRVVPREDAVALWVDWAWIGDDASNYVLRIQRDLAEGGWERRLEWMEACKPEAIRALSKIIPGPALLWIHDDPRGLVVRRGMEELGVLSADWAEFSP